MNITVGQKAPEFSLYNPQKNKINLSDYRGQNVLLLFFPLAFTSTCTKELCSVRDNIAFYSQMNAVVFGISVDSLYTLGKFRDEQGINFDLLSDFNKETSRAYGSLYETFSYDMKGVSKRSAFIVNKEGLIKYAEVLENASEVPDFNAIKQTLEKLA